MLCWLIYLESYAQMGQASVSCSNGCSCQPFDLDGYKLAKQSISALKRFTIFPINKEGPTGEPEQCLVKVRVGVGGKGWQLPAPRLWTDSYAPAP